MATDVNKYKLITQEARYSHWDRADGNLRLQWIYHITKKPIFLYPGCLFKALRHLYLL